MQRLTLASFTATVTCRFSKSPDHSYPDRKEPGWASVLGHGNSGERIIPVQGRTLAVLLSIRNAAVFLGVSPTLPTRFDTAGIVIEVEDC